VADGDEQRQAARALVVFAAARVVLFLAVLVVVHLLVADVLLALAASFLISAVLAVPLLRGPRSRLASATAARAARRRERPAPDR
jgi:hypothetical protein